MSNMKSRIVRSLVILTAALGLGTGCGGTLEEQLEPTQEFEVLVQEAETEEPRKVEDLIGSLDREKGVLHALDTAQDIVLSQLKAVRLSDGTFQTKDELTGDVTNFQLVVYPYPRWIPFFKICSNGQIVPYYAVCPTNIYSDPFTRIWRNATCNRKVQSASWSACTNTSSGGSYNYQYREAWKCGRGTGYCVERRAIRTVRYNYDLAYCDPYIVTGITPVSYDFLCRP